MKDREKELSKALAEFTTHLIDRYDSDYQSAKNQLIVKGVFAGASCGGLVYYAKKMRSLAYEGLSLAEIAELEKRSLDGKSASLENKSERT